MAGRRSMPSSHQAEDQVEMQDNNVEPLSYYMSRGIARSENETVAYHFCVDVLLVVVSVSRFRLVFRVLQMTLSAKSGVIVSRGTRFYWLSHQGPPNAYPELNTLATVLLFWGASWTKFF